MTSQSLAENCCSAEVFAAISSSTKSMKKYEKSFFNRTDLVSLLENDRLTLKKSSVLNFDNGDSLTTEDYDNLTGLTKEQFEDFSCHVTSIRHSTVRSNTCSCIQNVSSVVNKFDLQYIYYLYMYLA